MKSSLYNVWDLVAYTFEYDVDERIADIGALERQRHQLNARGVEGMGHRVRELVEPETKGWKN